MTRLANDFKEFLSLLKAHEVQYLLVGGYAVGYYGYPRSTADLDIWVRAHPTNARRLVAALRAFGFAVPELSEDIFLHERRIVRMGVPPMRIEIMTTISGVRFEECHAARVTGVLDEIEVDVIALDHLKANKRAAGRHKDLADLEHLPDSAP